MGQHEATDQLPLWGKHREPLDVRYARWRASEDGQDVFRRVEQVALDMLAGGAERIEVNLLYAQVRAVRHQSADNSYRAPIARELIDQHPQLRGIIRVKKRKGQLA